MFLIKELADDSQLCKVLLGIDIKKHERKLMSFIPALYEVREQDGSVRRRKFGAGQKGVLPIILEKLVFILFYCKIYPTHDVSGLLWRIDRYQMSVGKKLLLVLESALGFASPSLSPKRSISSMKELFGVFPHVKNILYEEKPIQGRTSKQHAKSLLFATKIAVLGC